MITCQYVFNVATDEHITSVVEFVKSSGIVCSVYGSQYLMDVLYNAEEEDYALKLLTDICNRSWYNMIRIGSTITLKVWDLKYKNNLDGNHAWRAVPANVVPRGLWGIRPKSPGFGIATIKPQMSDLKNSAIQVPTIKGTIKANYSYKNPKLQVYTIEIPANMLAEFELNTSTENVIKLDGKKINATFATIRLSPGIHQIDLVVNSF